MTATFKSILAQRLAPALLLQKDGAYLPHQAHRDQPMAPPPTNKLPASDFPEFPPMEPTRPHESPFLTRVYALARTWVQEEWIAIESLRHTVGRHNKSKLEHAIRDARLTPDNMAKHLDNISRAKLFRELRKLNAPPPALIIRQTRIEFGAHLLTHTRLLIRDIALRAGFNDERYFAELFNEQHKCSPSKFRRMHIHRSAIKRETPTE